MVKVTPHARFTEIATGETVQVETPFTWGSDVALFFVVRYPSGRCYCVPQELFDLHFKIVSPQKVYVEVWGGIDDRPNAKQREAESCIGSVQS